MEDSGVLLLIPKGKLDQVHQMLWADFEEVLIAIEAKITLAERDQSFVGYFIFTIGAMYFFEKKSLSRPDFVVKYTVLDCQKLTVRPSFGFDLDFESTVISVETEFGADVALIVARFLRRTFWDLPFLSVMEVSPPQEAALAENIHERQKNSLRDRGLLMAHFYNYYQEDRTVFEYFEKWEQHPEKIITLGGHFQAGVFATALGHALAWETEIENVNIQSLHKPFISRTVAALMQNAVTINKLIFTFYASDKVPSFDFKHVHEMKIKKFWFSRCCSQMIAEFFDKTANCLNQNMEEISIARMKIASSDFSDITSAVCHSSSSRKAKKIRFSTLRAKNAFPFDDVSRLLKNMDKLQQIIFTDVDMEGSLLLRSCLIAASPVKIIKIEYATFNKALDFPKKNTLPPQLVYLSLSHCEFPKASVLSSIFSALTNKRVNIPFILQMQSLDFGKKNEDFLDGVNISKCQPNFLEFDWSDNLIPKSLAKKLYTFLLTQNRLRMLVFQNIKLQNTEQFWKYVVNLVMKLKLLGIEVTGKFPGTIFSTFINNLQEATFLQRLVLRCPASHDSGLKAIEKIIKGMPNLHEIYCDGFRPEKQDSFLNVWKTIVEHPAIHSSEFPSYDLKVLKKGKVALSSALRNVMSQAKKKCTPSTLSQRATSLAEQIERAEDVSDTLSSVFSQLADQSWEESSGDEDDELFASKDI